MNTNIKLVLTIFITLAVVFTKETPPTTADAIIRKQKCVYREGMDSSKGKNYFYKTGPKYLLTLNKAECTKVKANLTKANNIYEIYEADFSIQKD